VQPQLTGDRLDRIATFLRHPYGAVAFRGVFRRSVLDLGYYLPAAADGYGADQLWVLALAGEGELLRVPGVVYRKRIHASSVTAQWRSRSPLARAAPWVGHCLDCYTVAEAAPDWSLGERLMIAAAAAVRVTAPMRRQVDGARQRWQSRLRRPLGEQ
jgi:hypothetical protein